MARLQPYVNGWELKALLRVMSYAGYAFSCAIFSQAVKGFIPKVMVRRRMADFRHPGMYAPAILDILLMHDKR